MHSTDIVAYTYRSQLYCPACIHNALATGPGEDFDGWAFGPGAEPRGDSAVETALDELALAFGVNRGDESSFDLDYFPHVVTLDDYYYDAVCYSCGQDLDR